MSETASVRVANSSLYLIYEWEERVPRVRFSVKEIDKELKGKAIVGLGDNQILLHLGSQRIEGQCIGAKEDKDGKVWISYKVDGELESFSPLDILNEIFEEQQKTESGRRALRTHVQGSENEIRRCDVLNRDYEIQWNFFNQLLESYHAYGTERLASFFDEGREIKKTDLKMNHREIASKMLVPDYRKRKFRGWRLTAEHYAKRYTSFGKDIDPRSLETTAKGVFAEEEEFSKKQ